MTPMASPGGQLEGKVVLVSGGASDIGRATACCAWPAPGAAVVIGDVSADGAASVAEEVEGAGGRAVGLACDVRPRIRWLRAVAVASLPSTGRSTPSTTRAWSHPRLDTDAVGVDLGVWERAIEITTRSAPAAGTPRRPRHGGGRRRVHRHHLVGDEHHRRVDPRGLRGVQGRDRTAHPPPRGPLRPPGSPRQCRRPGFILTDTANGAGPRGRQERLAEANPIRRLGTPDDIARVVAFLFTPPRPSSTARCSTSTAATRSPG